MPPPTPAEDSSIRVVVIPSQSSYFAGEPFTVTITLTNTRTAEAEAGPSRARPQGAGHRRGVHSISSAPLARPPTSPGTPRMVPPPPPTEPDVKEKGKESEVGDLMEQRRKKLLSRNMSVTVDARDIEDLSSKSASYAQGSSLCPPRQRVNTPHPSLALLRSLLTTHTQGRTRSSMGSLLFPLRHLHLPPSTATERVHINIHTPPRPHIRRRSPVRAKQREPGRTEHRSAHQTLQPTYRIKWQRERTRICLSSTLPPAPPPKHRPAQLQGLGSPPSSPLPPSLSSTKKTIPPHPNAETILYAYAQLAGSLVITPLPGIPTLAQEENLRRVKRKLGRGRVVGGGSMDISSSIASPGLMSAGRKRHGRSASLSAGLMSLISPRPWGRSLSSATFGTSAGGGGSSPITPTFPGSFPPIGGIEEDVDPEAPLPTFEVQPAMLGVDLWLMPGETRSYTYTVPLPANLPPTFRGKAMKVSYELVVGTCRASGGGQGPHNAPPKPYDILWPVRKPLGLDVQGIVVETTSASSTTREEGEKKGTEEELRRYARRLISTLPAPEDDDGYWGWEKGQDLHEEFEGRDGEEEESGGCREAVEVLTRNMKKASYDVTKDGVKVAVLTFSKSAYRLGETITGVVEVNERKGRARVVKLSATLEAHELLPASISPPSASRHLRRAHAEHYASFTLNTLRTTFSLDIPSDAAPVFGVSIPSVGEVPLGTGRENGAGRVEWKVRLCLLVAVASPSAATGTEGVVFKSLVRDGPRGEWGSPFRAPRSLAPLEKPTLASSPSGQKSTWTSFFSGVFAGEREYHDGDDLAFEEEEAGYDGIKHDAGGGVGVGVDYGGGDEGSWREVRMETVECEVPVGVWPGNTVYRSQEVVFDV
ncbi:Rgp1-domain-containing protein [Cyathus striatus]|nr:Rgp1-domain-containing protein [Cyathus striatus]